MSEAVAARNPVAVGATLEPRFYARMAWIFLAVGVIGFAPTYWLPLFGGELEVPPLTHLHGLLFYGWLVLFAWQATLIERGRVARHREVGVAGVALATAMCFVGTATALQSIRLQQAGGFEEAARAFSIVPLTSVVLFAGLFVAALVNVKRPDLHKRLMLVNTATLLQAGVARWFLLFLAPPRVPGTLPPPPPMVVTLGPSAMIDLFIVAMMIHDKRTLGRVHGAYWVAGAAVVFLQVVRVPVAGTDAWMQVTDWLLALTP